MLKVEQRGSVLNLTLNRPEVRNAFNDELIAALTRAVKNIAESTRAIVIRGEGPGFCAGGDLEWMRKAAGYSEQQNVDDALKLAALFQSLNDSPAVVFAMVQGAAFGGGSGLVAASDVSIAHPDAKFAFSEVKLGLVPATISPFVISKIGRGQAKALFSTGEPFGADVALRIGLVQEVAEDMETALERKLKHVLASGPKAVAMSKAMALSENLEPETTARMLARARAGDEGKEGVAAFLEKRRAIFVEDVEARAS
jgi:enoyl-CoA hydratase/carnithine racemase